MAHPLTTPTSTTTTPPPLTAARAIALSRRWRMGATVLNGLLAVGFAATLFTQHSTAWAMLPTVGVAVLWVALIVLSVKSTRLAAGAVPLIAAGDFDGAERRLDSSMRAFSVLRGGKLLGLHQLAALRHAQRRWGDAALLSRELLARDGDAGTPSRLLLIESLLELGDLPGVDRQLIELSTQRLSLREGLVAMLLRLDYLSRLDRWPAMAANLAADAELAELLPARASAKAQALLALAARETGRPDWAEWLRCRAELLCDPADLVRHRPVLARLWPDAPPTGAERPEA